MKVARILVTTRCNRNCSYCANKHLNVVNIAHKLNHIADLIPCYDAYILTGGEPALVPERIEEALDYLPLNKPVYMYTATWIQQWENIFASVDGITYSVHAPMQPNDICDFHKVQNELLYYKRPDLSTHLFIHPEINKQLTINTRVWSRILMPEKVDNTTCKLPDNEELFIWKE